MKSMVVCFAVAVVGVSSFAQGLPRNEWYGGLALEDAIGRADLIVAVRVETVSVVRVVHGGKGEGESLQFTFRPLRVLKGVFARTELGLTSDDLSGYGRAGGLREIKAGQTRLLFLGRSDVGYRNVGFPDYGHDTVLDHGIPPLASENDPLLQSVGTLLAVAAEPDRVKRVELLVKAVGEGSGPGVVPLLVALSSRALIAAQQSGAAGAVTKHLSSPSPAMVEAAASTLGAILEADYLQQDGLHRQAETALAAALAGGLRNIRARKALIDASGALRVTDNAALIAQLDFNRPGLSLGERDAMCRAAGRLQLPHAAEKLLALSQSMPVDSPFSDGIGRILAQADAKRGAEEMERRIRERMASGLDGSDEIVSVNALPAGDAAKLLVRLFELPLDSSERRRWAQTAARICRDKPEGILVGPLSQLLDPDEAPVRAASVDALLHIGSPAAARVLQTQIAREGDLARKLEIAELLGKHGMNDGYAYAIEHVSQFYLTDKAVSALVAMKDPRAAAEAKRILETSNDKTWNSAAVRILGAMGATEFATKFLGFASDWKNPLAPAALVALADLGEAKALPRIRDALSARNDEIVVAGARAAKALLAKPGLHDDSIRDQLAALVTDSSASEQTRSAALAALKDLDDPRLNKALVTAASDAGIERTSLLAELERLLRDRKLKIP